MNTDENRMDRERMLLDHLRLNLAHSGFSEREADHLIFVKWLNDRAPLEPIHAPVS